MTQEACGMQRSAQHLASAEPFGRFRVLRGLGRLRLAF